MNKKKLIKNCLDVLHLMSYLFMIFGLLILIYGAIQTFYEDPPSNMCHDVCNSKNETYYEYVINLFSSNICLCKTINGEITTQMVG